MRNSSPDSSGIRSTRARHAPTGRAGRSRPRRSRTPPTTCVTCSRCTRTCRPRWSRRAAPTGSPRKRPPIENPALYRTDPALAWRRLKGLNRLRPVEQSAARALADWRERRAIESDKPRGWILADEALYALATRDPVSIAALESVPTLPPSVIRKRGDELLELLRAARADESGVPLAAPKRPEPAQMALATRLLQVVRDVAAELEVGAEVLATRRDVEAIAFGSGRARRRVRSCAAGAGR